VRVIAGSAKGISLSSLNGDRTRPILEKIKGSLFNILANVVPESRVLDMFAGTGSIGIEALSRGAKSCIFVECNKSAIQIIKKNLEATGFRDKSQVLECDVFKIIPYLESNKSEIDIAFAGPPYPLIDESPTRDNLLKLFSNLCDKQIILPDGIMVLQHRKGNVVIPPAACCIELFDSRLYGVTQLSFFKVVGDIY